MPAAPEPVSLCRYGPQEEVLHDPAARPRYNESAYFNFTAGDVADGPLGGVLRVGLRPTEGYAEFFVCLPMADGTTLYWSGRDELAAGGFAIGSPRWASGPLSAEAVQPGVRWDIRYDGELRRVASADELSRLGQALKVSPAVPSVLELTFEAARPLHVMQESGDMIPGEEAAKDHYEQFGRLTGTLTADGTTHEIRAAPAFRDHSWGPRDYVAAMSDMDWFTAQLDGGPDIVGYRIRSRPDLPVQGAELSGRGVRYLSDVAVHTDWAGHTALGGELELTVAVDGSVRTMTAHVQRGVLVKHRGPAATAHNTFALVRIDADGLRGGGWVDLNRPVNEPPRR